MRTHQQIIEAAGGYKPLAIALGLPVERVRFWERRQAIPPGQWVSVAEANIASLDELAAAARQRSAA